MRNACLKALLVLGVLVCLSPAMLLAQGDGDLSVTIELNDDEREVLNLAIPGYIADLEKEVEGADRGNFVFRRDGLQFFVDVTVPSIREKINPRSAGDPRAER